MSFISSLVTALNTMAVMRYTTTAAPIAAQVEIDQKTLLGAWTLKKESVELTLNLKKDGKLEQTMLISSPEMGGSVRANIAGTWIAAGDSITIRGRRVITGFDKAVYNTVSTLYAAGNREVSATDIFRTMNGNTDKRPSAAQVERITNSIRKWMYTALYMDMTQELQHKRLTLDDERIINGKVETQMLQATIGTARTKKGSEIAVFRLAAEPILYTYCKGKKQIITVPIALLDTAEAASNTEGLTAIREYLLQQIELMKTGNRDNPTIKYATIYEETGIEPPTARKDAMRLRNQIKAVLDVWKDRGYILGYTDAKTGAAVTGITISYESRKK